MAKIAASQAEDAKKQLQLARDVFLASNRPRLSLREAYTEQYAADQSPIAAHYAIVNLGNTAATIVDCKFSLGFDVCSTPRRQVALDPGSNAIPVNTRIEPGASQTGTYQDAAVNWNVMLLSGRSPSSGKTERWVVTDSVLQDGNSTAQRAYFFYGRIRYKDGGGISREMAFYRQLERGSYRFVPWNDPQLEYSDRNP